MSCRSLAITSWRCVIIASAPTALASAPVARASAAIRASRSAASAARRVSTSSGSAATGVIPEVNQGQSRFASTILRRKSARGLGSVGQLRVPPVNAVEHIGQLCGGDRRRITRGRGPEEASSFQPLGVERHAQPVMPQDIEQVATRPRNTYKSPACGSRANASCTCKARPFMPRRISV